MYNTAEYSRRRREKFKREQRCYRCGGKDARTISGYTRCAECAAVCKDESKAWNELNPERRKKAYEVRKVKIEQCRNSGLCIKCMNNLADEGKRMCSECREKYNTYMRERHKRKREQQRKEGV